MFNANRASLLGAAVFALSLSSGLVANSFAKEKTIEVGGAAMYPSKNIIENAVNSKDHTTLVAAVKAAGLVEYTRGQRPVHRLRADQRGVRQASRRHGCDLLKPENKTQLTNVLTYHVVAG